MTLPFIVAVVSQNKRQDLGSILHCVSKKVPTFKFSVTLSNLNRFPKCLHCWKAYEICYKTRMKLPTSP